jgi:hypothetical protein
MRRNKAALPEAAFLVSQGLLNGIRIVEHFAPAVQYLTSAQSSVPKPFIREVSLIF